MKKQCLIKLICLLTFAAGTFACFPAARAADQTDFELQPIFTRYAKTITKLTFRSTFSAFNGVELQEADHFNGMSVNGELEIPFTERIFFTLSSPIYTTGEAKLKKPGHQSIDLWGWSDTFQFPTVQMQWQLLTEAKSGLNMAVSSGVGRILGTLHTNTKPRDIYNHAGLNVTGGLKADRRINEWITLLGNLDVTYYITSDDLHPGGGDSWMLTQLSAAVVFRPWEARIYPAVELILSSDFSSYNTAMIVPEVIIPACKNFEFKVGATLGLTDLGEDYGARVQSVFRF